MLQKRQKIVQNLYSNQTFGRQTDDTSSLQKDTMNAFRERLYSVVLRVLPDPWPRTGEEQMKLW